MSRAGAKSLPQLSLRIDLDGEDRIGPGKIELLEQIREQGSISAAGRAMDMSYKRAWDLVDEINRICGHPVVEPQAGGKNGGGAMLTPFGEKLVALGKSTSVCCEHTPTGLRAIAIPANIREKLL